MTDPTMSDPTSCARQVLPECSRPLDFDECLGRWQREAAAGSIDVGRYRLPYSVWGRGPTVVFVPGLCGEAMAFVPVMARLAVRFRCVSYDLPSSVGALTLDELSADLLSLLDHLGVGNCVCVGVSLGGAIALGAMQRHPGRIRSAALLQAWARRSLAPAELFLASCARYAPGRLARLPGFGGLVRQQNAALAARAPTRLPFVTRCLGATRIADLAQRSLLMHRLDLRPMLPTLSQPILVVEGEEAPAREQAASAELRALLPRVGHAQIENCATQPHLSQPEVLAELLGPFLEAR